jgi:hypothetical protein
MCEACEQGETLDVVYSRRVDRRGWRPRAKAASEPRLTDARTPTKSVATFACEGSRDTKRQSEIG